MKNMLNQLDDFPNARNVIKNQEKLMNVIAESKDEEIIITNYQVLVLHFSARVSMNLIYFLGSIYKASCFG